MSARPESGRLESMDITLVQPRDATSYPAAVAPVAAGSESELGPAWCLLAAPVAAGLASAAVVVAAAGSGVTPTQLVGAVLVVLWAIAGLALGVRRRHDRLGPIVLAGAAIGGGLCLAQAVGARDDLADWSEAAAVAVRFTASLLPAAALHMLTALPDGRPRWRARRRRSID